VIDLLNVQSLNILDWIVVGIIVVSLLLGIIRGLVRELLALTTWIVSILLAREYGLVVGDKVGLWSDSEQISNFIGLSLVFVGSFLGLALFGRLITKQFRISGLTLFNRAFGATFGILRGIILAVLLILLAEAIPITDSALYTDSEVAPLLRPFVIFADDLVFQQLLTRQ
tara:strand:- start:752 stop:1261 length:510 start_codon:yes stop_codon:yes gene_type:complete